MRVIAGTARSMPLKTIKGMDTRPTTDKTKETLFNVLQTDIPDCRFLDLFSGSGAIAIEALSRGAAYAVLVEQNAKAAECIKENLIFTKTMERAEIQKCDVLTALHRMEGQKPFDVIFMDPPREGSTPQFIESVARMAPKRVVYVSCNPETLARDLALLTKKGYRVESSTPVDMFPHSEHIEVVCALSRRHKA